MWLNDVESYTGNKFGVYLPSNIHKALEGNTQASLLVKKKYQWSYPFVNSVNTISTCKELHAHLCDSGTNFIGVKNCAVVGFKGNFLRMNSYGLIQKPIACEVMGPWWKKFYYFIKVTKH